MCITDDTIRIFLKIDIESFKSINKIVHICDEMEALVHLLRGGSTSSRLENMANYRK